MLAFQGGAEDAFDRLVGRYQSTVYHFIVRTIRDAGRAEDLTQEVFLRVYRSRERYKPVANFKTWLFTIANRLALNELRAVRRRRRIFVEAGGMDGSPGSAKSHDDFWANVPDRQCASPSEPVEEDELERVIGELLNRLPENQRAAIQLQRSETFSYQDIAEVLQVSTMAVKALLVRAREDLKIGLERYLEGKNNLLGKKP